MKSAETRARTQSGDRLSMSALVSDTKVSQAPPLTSMTSMRAGRLCRRERATIVTPRMATAMETTASVDHRARTA